MKLYHAGLLLAGAGLAAGIAFRMTQPPPIPVPASITHPPIPPPPAADVPVKKPSPIEAPRTSASTTVRTPAPETVYDQPARQADRKNEANSQPAPGRKNEPNLTADLKSTKPKQWIPGRYDSRGGTGATVAEASPARKPAAPVVAASIDKSAASVVQLAIEAKTAPATPPPAPAHHATLQTGMAIVIRLRESLTSNYSRTGGSFAGELAEPLIADGFVIAEAGAHVTGRIVESDKAGRSTGSSRLSLGLTNVSTSDGQTVSVTTDPWMKLGDSVAAGTIIPFRLTSKVTITEQQAAAK